MNKWWRAVISRNPAGQVTSSHHASVAEQLDPQLAESSPTRCRSGDGPCWYTRARPPAHARTTIFSASPSVPTLVRRVYLTRKDHTMAAGVSR